MKMTWQFYSGADEIFWGKGLSRRVARLEQAGDAEFAIKELERLKNRADQDAELCAAALGRLRVRKLLGLLGGESALFQEDRG